MNNSELNNLNVFPCCSHCVAKLATIADENGRLKEREVGYRALIADILRPAEDRYIVGKNLTDEDNLRSWVRRALNLMSPGKCWDRTPSLPQVITCVQPRPGKSGLSIHEGCDHDPIVADPDWQNKYREENP